MLLMSGATAVPMPGDDAPPGATVEVADRPALYATIATTTTIANMPSAMMGRGSDLG
jgi:hypothetical protein